MISPLTFFFRSLTPLSDQLTFVIQADVEGIGRNSTLENARYVFPRVIDLCHYSLRILELKKSKVGASDETRATDNHFPDIWIF